MELRVVRCMAGDLLALKDEDAFAREFGSAAVLLVAREPVKLAWQCWLPATLWLAPSGELRVDVDGQPERVDGHSPLLTADGERVSAGAVDGGEPAWLFGLVLPDEVRQQVAKAAGRMDLAPPTVRLDGASALAAELTRFALRHEVGAASREIARDGLVRVLDSLRRELQRFDPLIEQCPGQTLARRQALLRRLLRARRRLEGLGGVDVPLKRLAADAGLSPCHFLRVFRRVFGCTPHAMATRQRVDLACRLVLRTALPVSRIGQRIGISNPSAFAQFFRHHVGVAASRLREVHAGGGAEPPIAA